MSRTAFPSPPSWLSGLRPGCWYRISGDAPDLGLSPTEPGTRYLCDTDPALDPSLNPPRSLRERARRLAGRRPRAPWSGKLGFAAITEAWNGAVWASGFGDCGSMVVFGGGHNDYFGSSVHAFDLASRRWTRLSDGFTHGGPGAYGEGAEYTSCQYPDGSPLPPHTYEYVQYDGERNRLMLFKGQRELGPNVRAAAVPQVLDLAVMQWLRGPEHPSAILNSGGWTCWDTRRRVLWGNSGDDANGNAFLGFRPDGRNSDGTIGEWTGKQPNLLPGHANHCSATYDPIRDRMVVAVPSLDAVLVLDPDRRGEGLADPGCNGQRPTLRPYAALRYSSQCDCPVYFSSGDGPALFALDYTDRGWRWRSLLDTRKNAVDPVADAAATTVFEANVSHTFGRFRIARFAGVELAILVRHIDSPVYVFQLPK